MIRRTLPVAGAVLALLVAGCGGGDDKNADDGKAASKIPLTPAKAPPPTPESLTAKLTKFERGQIKQALVVVQAKCNDNDSDAGDTGAYEISLFLDGLLTPMLSKPDATYGARTLRKVGEATAAKLKRCDLDDQAKRITDGLGGSAGDDG